MNNVIEEFVFHTGWKKQGNIKLFDKKYAITIKLQAYFEKDGITDEQKNAYLTYKKNETNIWKIIEQLVFDFNTDGFSRFIPSTFLFGRDGSYALLCDDNIDLDQGIAVCIEPLRKIISQDEYL